MNYRTNGLASPILNNKDLYFGLIITFIISILIFYCAFLFAVWQGTNVHWVSDLHVHAQAVLDAASTHHFPVYSLWYRLVYIISGFSKQYNHIAYASIVLLALLTVAKYIISYHILRNNCPVKGKGIALVSFSLIFIMPVLSYYSCSGVSVCINNYHVVIGNIVPNQWHNSTLILAMPFNLLLFYYSVKEIRAERWSSFLIMGILSLISILCKPNFSLAYLPILCVAILILNFNSHHYFQAFIKCALVAIPSLLVLLYQWYFTFIDSSVPLHNSKTIIAPFLVWSHFSPHIIISLLLSIAFPLSIFILYFEKINLYLILAWLTFLLAVASFSFLAEYPNWVNGNYGWGLISSCYILFLFSAVCLLNQPFDWKTKVAYTVLVIHFLSGCFLLGSFFIRQTSLLL
ncbi:hypothetical protein [Legionella sp. PC997]|uniref:hypothetical protein n=1 Tax=Legionella sp. PC997 TaxID=2755562 RepID=UPI0015FC866D|nr:hypothetical protein [Legionella sp. PC997]QMT58823.1 hypothetical protein HBNCFIEN_00176 [Legionella sp. PC997]